MGMQLGTADIQKFCWPKWNVECKMRTFGSVGDICSLGNDVEQGTTLSKYTMFHVPITESQMH